MKHSKLSIVLLLLSVCTLLVQVSSDSEQLQQHADLLHPRLKRQAQQQATRGQPPAMAGNEAQASAMAASMASSSMPVGGSGRQMSGFSPSERDQDVPVNVGRPEDYEDRPQDARPAVQKQARKPPRRPTSFSQPPVNEPDNEEDCYDDDGREYDDYNSFFRMATRPMRQFGRIMNDVFRNMPDMNYDDYQGRGGNSVAASSSSFNNGDGFSRLSSSVSNNGRIRGIVSETRNGRTQTRRIGERNTNDDDSYYDDE